MRKVDIVKLTISYLNLVRLIPHVICYFLYYDRLREDLEVARAHRRMTCSIFSIFLYQLIFDKFYRTLFYHRIGISSHSFSFLLPPDNCFFIGTDVRIGEGVLLFHPFATIINAEKIGDGLVIKNNVTIGYNYDKRPVIGNNVEINVNCVISGGIHIGDNVVIGAGTVLFKSVPDNCTVIGNPAYIIKQNGKKVSIKL